MSQEETNLPQATTETTTPAAGLSIETEAREMGWKPLEEFEGNKDNWADAKEYVRVGKLIKTKDDKNSKLEKELKELKNITKTMLSSMQKQEAEAYTRASRDLELKLARAKEIGDVEEALDISQQQKNLKEAVVKSQQQQQSNIIDSEEFQNFFPTNQWVLGTDRKSKAMQAVASDISNEYVKKNPGATRQEEFDYIHKEMRKEFPEYFKAEETSKKTTSAVVSGDSTKPDQGDRGTKLSPEEKQVVEYLKLRGYDYKAYTKSLGK